MCYCAPFWTKSAYVLHFWTISATVPHFRQKMLLCPIRQIMLLLWPIFDKKCYYSCAPFSTKLLLLLCPIFDKKCYCCAPFSPKGARAVLYFRRKVPLLCPIFDKSATVPHFRQQVLVLCPIIDKKLLRQLCPTFDKKRCFAPFSLLLCPLTCPVSKRGSHSITTGFLVCFSESGGLR